MNEVIKSVFGRKEKGTAQAQTDTIDTMMSVAGKNGGI